MKHLKTYNESLRDQMTPVSDEELKKNLGEEKFTSYKKLLDVEDSLNKKPFGYSIIYKDANPIFLSIDTELNNFIIEYNDGKYVLKVMGQTRKYDTKDELLNEMKNITLDCLDDYEKDRKEEMNNIQSDIDNMKEEISIITKNF